jgi:Xaa-Pro aminopeptidase
MKSSRSSRDPITQKILLIMTKEQKQFHKSRRAKLLEKIGKDSIAIIVSNSMRNSSYDADYKFKQNKNFYYLTGFNEPDSLLVLSPEKIKIPIDDKKKQFKEVNEVLFVRPKNQRAEMWTGRRLGAEKVTSELGIQHGLSIKDLEVFMQYIMGKTHKNFYLDIVEMFSIEGKVREYLTPFMQSLRVNAFNFQIIDIAHILGMMRKIKTSFEVSQIQKAVNITAESFIDTERQIKPYLYEYQVQAFLEYNYKMRGASDMAFHTIVASGDNANILHYETNQDVIEKDSLVLIDSGAEYNYYCADITRTFPASGKLTDAQRDIYEIVLDTNKKCIAKIKPGVKLSYLRKYCDELIVAGLKKLKLIKKSDNGKSFLFHGVGHHLGLDTHDAVPYGKGNTFDNDTLKPGMVITIEPGIYLDKKRKDIPAKYRGIGVRIEDDVLVTRDGRKNLSQGIPKEVNDIEIN